MERLSLSEDTAYDPMEAAIHVGRYSILKDFCEGKTVLDIACGEGYGSAIIAKEWGAKEVIGVDISEEAINSAKSNFGGYDNLIFLQSSVYELTNIIKNKKFDIIVSLETIEHLELPEVFLEIINNHKKQNSLIVISCPNDNLYYPTEMERNPFHFKKYTENDFYEMAEKALGKAAYKLRGAPLKGYANISINTGLDQKAASSLDVTKIQDLNNELIFLSPGVDLTSANCSYYMGIWGKVTIPKLAGTNYVSPLPLPEITAKNDLLDAQLETTLIEKLRKTESLLKSETISRIAANEEIRKLEDVISQLRSSNFPKDYDELYQDIPWRVVGIYKRIRPFIPGRLLNFMARIIDKFR